MKLKPEIVTEMASRMQASRNRRGWTYAELARRSGVEASQTQKICQGEFRSLTTNVLQICSALEVSFGDSGHYEGRLTTEIIALWDRTSADGERLLRLLRDLRELRGV
ncbi:helix-turn-helix transcriptional regulator [Devosia sp.]|uniref:helix-turn-helix domain-containing protein n=1 Tax=Devosia sp. TaxID=1871048 RepID=UPI002637CBB5|nr:helix-turn-helix transcriptional regulator [Devosia sp.]